MNAQPDYTNLRIRKPKLPMPDKSSAQLERLADVLDRIDEYLAQREDVRDSGDGPRPNEEMTLLTDLRYARSERGLTCEHGTVGYCEKCALRDPGELGETKPALVRSAVAAPSRTVNDILAALDEGSISRTEALERIEPHLRIPSSASEKIEPSKLRGEARQKYIHDHDCPKAWEFFHKHAMGSKLCPSCFACGHQAHDRADWWITHGELPDVYICKGCVEKLRAPLSAGEAPEAVKFDKWWESQDKEKGWNEAIRAAIQMAQTATATRDGITVRACSEQVALLLETLLIDVPSTGDGK